MTFFSLLYETKQQEQGSNKEQPLFMKDLNLDQIINEIFPEGLTEDIQNIVFYLPNDESLIRYREEILKDLFKEDIYKSIIKYYGGIERCLHFIKDGKEANHEIQKDKYYLDSFLLYYEAINELIESIDSLDVKSKGMKLLLDNLKQYHSNITLKNQYKWAKKIQQEIENIYYTLTISSGKILLRFEKELTDFTKGIQEVLGYKDDKYSEIRFFSQVDLVPLEMKIADIIQKKYLSLFRECKEFNLGNQDFIHINLKTLQRELFYYMHIIDFINKQKEKGFTFTYPKLNKNSTELKIYGLYDLALAIKATDSRQVVSNDFYLSGEEKGAWITGANQGGKTTFAKSFGQVVYFAALGLPVPAEDATIPYYNQIFTYFSEEESNIVSNGKLKEDLIRLKPIVHHVKPNSLVILNELFSSTTALDAYEMGKLLVSDLLEKGGTVLCVTHVPKLAKSCEGMVSLVAEIKYNQGKLRTYKISRKEAEETAYAESIALKYHLTYHEVKEKINHAR